MSELPRPIEVVGDERAVRIARAKSLAVVLGIVILMSGLYLGGLNYIKAKQAREMAKLQVSLLKNALAVFKADTGGVPAHAVIHGRGGTQKLHAALFPGVPDAKIYLPELDPAHDPQGWLAGKTGPLPLKIYDPWGNEFFYRSNRPGSPAVFAKNPDFDLWSAGPDGRTTATAGGGYNPRHLDNLDDIGF